MIQTGNYFFRLALQPGSFPNTIFDGLLTMSTGSDFWAKNTVSILFHISIGIVVLFCFVPFFQVVILPLLTLLGKLKYVENEDGPVHCASVFHP